MAEVSLAGNPRVELDGRAITVSMWSRMGAPGLASPPAADVDSASQIDRRWCESVAAAAANSVTRAQSCATTTSDGVIHEPPTQPTFGNAR